MLSLPSDEAFRWLPSEPQAITDAFTVSQAQSTPAVPGWAGYAENVSEALGSWIEEAVRPIGRLIGPGLRPWIEWSVIALVVIVVIVILARLVGSLSNGVEPLRLARRARVTMAPEVTAEQHRRDALRWLEQGEGRKALTSAWWWFAASALKASPDASMTTYDVLSRSRRADLRKDAQTLDRLRFDAATPAAVEVRKLFAAFEARL